MAPPPVKPANDVQLLFSNWLKSFCFNATLSVLGLEAAFKAVLLENPTLLGAKHECMKDRLLSKQFRKYLENLCKLLEPFIKVVKAIQVCSMLLC